MDPVSIVTGMFPGMSKREVIAVGEAAVTYLNSMSPGDTYELYHKKAPNLFSNGTKKTRMFKPAGREWWAASLQPKPMPPAGTQASVMKLAKMSFVVPANIKRVPDKTLLVIGCKHGSGDSYMLAKTCDHTYVTDLDEITAMSGAFDSASVPTMRKIEGVIPMAVMKSGSPYAHARLDCDPNKGFTKMQADEVALELEKAGLKLDYMRDSGKLAVIWGLMRISLQST